MTLQSTQLPGCCTARVVFGFGGSVTGSHAPRVPYTEADLNNELTALEQHQCKVGMAVLIVALNDDQVLADQVLASRGYVASPWMTKKNHSDKKLRVYYKALEEVSNG